MILKNTLFWQNFEKEPVADREWGEMGNFPLISHPPLTHKTQANLT